MKILVTGANGYLGQGIVKELLNRGAEVVATDFATNYIDKRAKIIGANIFDVEDPYNFFGRPDVLLHLAWRDGFKHDSMAHIEDFPKHCKFIMALSEEHIGKICVLGSVHEVGFYEGSVDENTPTNPQSLYGIAKNALRQVCEIETKKNQNLLQWLRGYYIVGNTEHGSSIFSKITEAANKKQKTFPFTSGQNQFDFIDYSEFCKQVAAVVLQNEENGIINCCSGNPMKLAERVEKFIKENGYDIELAYGTFPDRPYDSKAIWGNPTRIQKIMSKNAEEISGYYS